MAQNWIKCIDSWATVSEIFIFRYEFGYVNKSFLKICFQYFTMKNVKYTESVKEFYIAYLYTYLLDYIIDLFYLLVTYLFI